MTVLLSSLSLIAIIAATILFGVNIIEPNKFIEKSTSILIFITLVFLIARVALLS